MAKSNTHKIQKETEGAFFSQFKGKYKETVLIKLVLRRAPLSTRAMSISAGATLPLCTAAIEVSEAESEH